MYSIMDERGLSLHDVANAIDVFAFSNFITLSIVCTTSFLVSADAVISLLPGRKAGDKGQLHKPKRIIEC